MTTPTTIDTARALATAGALGVLLALAPTPAAAEQIPWEEANVYFELNDTDGDLGIHALVDGEPWRKMEILGPDGLTPHLKVKAKGPLRAQGMTEIFFESEEPDFEELPPEEFFDRFPEGDYAVAGKGLEGDTLFSTSEVTHLMPAPPGNVTVSGQPAAEDCDAEELPAVGDPVVIDWDPVTTSHPDLGRMNEPIEVEKYELVLEREEPTLLVLHVDLPPGVTSFEVPADFIALGDEFKFEIVTREASGNQTAIESCFEIDD